MSVPNTLQVIADVQALALSAVALVKGGKISILDLPQFLSLFEELVTISKDLPAALPELKALDAADVGTITSAGYTLVQTIFTALGASLTPAVAVVAPVVEVPVAPVE